MTLWFRENLAAIVGAYTGFLAGPFEDLHEYVEQVMGRPVFTHEMGNEKFADELRQRTRPDFLEIVRERPA